MNMGDLAGTEATDSTQTDTTPSELTESPELTTAPAESSGNPAWETLRSQLDPISFHAIEPELRKMDSAAQQRVQSVNEQYKPWKSFADEQVTPEQVGQWRSIAQQIDENPEIVYNYLGQYLQQTGRMPSQQEVAAEVAEQTGQEQEPTNTPDPRDQELQQLREQLSGVQQFIERQAQVDIQREADQAIETELSAFKAAHADLAPEDVREALRRTALIAQERQAQGNYTVPTLEEGYAELSAYRNRILTAPRPADSAPTLIPTSGGVPSGQQRTLGQLSNQETQNLIASLISQNKG